MNKFLLLFFLVSTVYGQDIIWPNNEAFTTSNIKSKIQTGKRTIVINSKIEVSGSVEVPKNVILKFKDKGVLSIKNEATRLVINEPVIAEKKVIFDLSAKGVVSYKFESVSNIQLNNTNVFYPEWWGIFPNVIPGQNGNTSPKQIHHTYLKEMMLDIAASGGGTIQFSEGVYYIRDIVIDSDNITVLGKGKNTILRFDRDNYGYSTRRGGIFTIQGPTLEKYYSKVFTEGVSLAGNFLYDTTQRTIENIVVKNLSIEWNEESTKEDPSMNGLTIVNAKKVEIENVHVNLFGANRAFYVGTIFEGDVTEDVIIKNCTGINARTGVFVLHGYDDAKDAIRKKMRLGNIVIENNEFKLQPIPELNIKNVHIVKKYLDKYATGIYFIGNEFTKSFNYRGESVIRSIGEIKILNNTFHNTDIGIRSWFPGKDPNKDYIHQVTIDNNTFVDFKYVGIFSPFKSAIITNNTFLSKNLNQLPQAFKDANEEGFIASAIHIAKAPWKEFKTKQGPENIIIEGNTIKGCYLNVIPIVVQPNEGATINVNENIINYDSSCKQPEFDIEIETNRRKFRTKRATINLQNNKIDTGNQKTNKASVLLNTRREKFINLIEN